MSEKMCPTLFFLKTATDVDNFVVCGRLLHTCGPAKVKACLPNSARLPEDVERSRCLAATAATGIHSSARYDGTSLCMALYALWHTVPVELVANPISDRKPALRPHGVGEVSTRRQTGDEQCRRVQYAQKSFKRTSLTASEHVVAEYYT